MNTETEFGIIRAGDTIQMTIKETVEHIKEHLEFSLDDDLVGQPIRITHAGEKYNVANSTLSHWVNSGLIKIINRGPKLCELDEAEVKLAAQIFHIAKKHTTPRKAAWVLKKALSNN